MSVPLTVPTLKTGHLKKNCPITTFSEAKDSQLFFLFFVCKPTNNIHKLRVIHIGVKASLWSFNQLDNCVLPRKALYWPYFVPRIILWAFYAPFQTNSPSSRRSRSKRRKRRKQVSPPASPSAALANFLYQLSLRLMQNFSPISYPSRGIGWLLCGCFFFVFFLAQSMFNAIEMTTQGQLWLATYNQ